MTVEVCYGLQANSCAIRGWHTERGCPAPGLRPRRGRAARHRRLRRPHAAEHGDRRGGGERGGWAGDAEARRGDRRGAGHGGGDVPGETLVLSHTASRILRHAPCRVLITYSHNGSP